MAIMRRYFDAGGPDVVSELTVLHDTWALFPLVLARLPGLGVRGYVVDFNHSGFHPSDFDFNHWLIAPVLCDEDLPIPEIEPIAEIVNPDVLFRYAIDRRLMGAFVNVDVWHALPPYGFCQFPQLGDITSGGHHLAPEVFSLLNVISLVIILGSGNNHFLHVLPWIGLYPAGMNAK